MTPCVFSFFLFFFQFFHYFSFSFGGWGVLEILIGNWWFGVTLVNWKCGGRSRRCNVITCKVFLQGDTWWLLDRLHSGSCDFC